MAGKSTINHNRLLVASTDQPKPVTTNTPPSPWWRIFRESVAVLFWLEIICTLFAFEPIGALTRKFFPSIEMVADYRFFVFLLFVSLIWLVLGNKRMRRLIGWVLWYPGLWLCWRVPICILKRWPIVVAFFPAIYHFARTFKSTFIMYSLAISMALAVILFSSKLLVIPAMVFLLVFFLYHFFMSIKNTYGSSAFSSLATFAKKGRKFVAEKMTTQFLKPSVQAVEIQTTTNGRSASPTTKQAKAPLSPERAQEQQFMAIYACGWLPKYFAHRLRDVAKTRLPEFYLATSWLYTAILCVGIFALEYYGLFKLDSTAFSKVGEYRVLSFVGLSMSRMLPSNLSQVTAETNWAYFLSYAQSVLVFGIVVLLVFALLTTKREKQNAEINEFVRELTEITKTIEKRVLELFAVTFSALEMLVAAKHISYVNWMRKSIGEDALPVSSTGQYDNISQATTDENIGKTATSAESSNVTNEQTNDTSDPRIEL